MSAGPLHAATPGARCWLLAAIVLAMPPGRAQEAAATTGDDVPPATSAALEALLAEEPKDSDYAEERRCLDPARVRDTEIVSETLIVFHTRPRGIWINQLEHPCENLERGATLVTESRSFGICELDTVRAFQPGSLTGSVFCRLGRFGQITSEQLDVLKAQYSHR
jgi:hypothetical protein